MSDPTLEGPKLDVTTLREAIQEEYAEVATNPDKGFHFHTGRPLARILEYTDEWLIGIPESSIESFASTGNPFSLGECAGNPNGGYAHHDGHGDHPSHGRDHSIDEIEHPLSR